MLGQAYLGWGYYYTAILLKLFISVYIIPLGVVAHISSWMIITQYQEYVFVSLLCRWHFAI